MSADRARKIVDVAGLSVVVLSVLLLAYQVQRGNEIAEATTTYELVANFNEFNLAAATDERLTNLYVGLAVADFEPTEEQAVTASLLAFAHLNLLITFELAHQNGLIDDI